MSAQRAHFHPIHWPEQKLLHHFFSFSKWLLMKMMRMWRMYAI